MALTLICARHSQSSFLAVVGHGMHAADSRHLFDVREWRQVHLLNRLGPAHVGGLWLRSTWITISTRALAQCFADWADPAGAPQSSEKTVAEGVRVEHNRWSCTGAMSESSW